MTLSNSINIADMATKGAINKFTMDHPISEDVAVQFKINPDVKDAKATVPNTQKSLTPWIKVLFSALQEVVRR